jgi:hypothetical protein
VDDAAGPKSVEGVAEQPPSSTVGRAVPGPDGVSTKIVPSRPCGTAAHESDGATTRGNPNEAIICTTWSSRSVNGVDGRNENGRNAGWRWSRLDRFRLCYRGRDQKRRFHSRAADLFLPAGPAQGKVPPPEENDLSIQMNALRLRNVAKLSSSRSTGTRMASRLWQQAGTSAGYSQIWLSEPR